MPQLFSLVGYKGFIDTIPWAYSAEDSVLTQVVLVATLDTFFFARGAIGAAYIPAEFQVVIEGALPNDTVWPFHGQTKDSTVILGEDYRGRECFPAVDAAKLARLANDTFPARWHFQILYMHCFVENQLPLDEVERGNADLDVIQFVGGVSPGIDSMNVNQVKPRDSRWSYAAAIDLKRRIEVEFGIVLRSTWENVITWVSIHELAHQFGISHPEEFPEFHNTGFMNDVMRGAATIGTMGDTDVPAFCHHGEGEDKTLRQSCRANIWMNRGSI